MPHTGAAGSPPAGVRTYPEVDENGVTQIWATDDAGNFWPIGPAGGGGGGAAPPGGGFGGGGALDVVPTELWDRELQELMLLLQTRIFEFQKFLAITELQANPRSLVQSLLLMGVTEEDAEAFLDQARGGGGVSVEQARQELADAGGDYWLTAPDEQVASEYEKLSGRTVGDAGVLGEEQVAAFLDATPMVQSLRSWEEGIGEAPPAIAEPTPERPVVTMPTDITPVSPTGSQLAPPSEAVPSGRNPLFPFISGRKLPVRQTLSDIQSGSQRIPLLAGLASFSGQDPGAFFGDFTSALPKGTKAPLTRVR